MASSERLDVQNKEFTRAIRGYAIEEVDAFLDRVTEELDRLRGEVKRLQEHRIEHADEQAIARALVTAQRAAEQTVEDAKAQAQTIRTDAETNATRTAETAQLRAREIVDAAELHAREVTEQLGQRRTELERSIRALEAFEGEYRSRLRGSVESMLEALDHATPKGPLAPPPPPGLVLSGAQGQTGHNSFRPSLDAGPSEASPNR
jgi:cell division initiation protein